ncbi:hypothetical protein LTS15_009683 [Exophiala xenobiotica]|nr:hypothetical protein LTS15_009683 [Exophiala xenobiotica]
MAITEVEHAVTSVASSEPVKVHAKTLIVVASVNFAYFAQLVSIVASGLLANGINTLFNGKNEGVWLSSVITIITVVLGPPVSQVADLWGRKWPLVIAMLCGCVGSIVASRAESMGTVIAGFSIIGVSFGGQPLLHAVVSEVLPRRQRPVAQATVNMTAGMGAFIGICMGGALLRHNVFNQYRIFMYVLAGIFFGAALGITLCYNPPARELQSSLTFGEKLRRLDWVGYGLFAPGLLLFCIALSWSENPYHWSNGRIIGPFVTGIVLMLAFLVYECLFKKNGILHHGLFTQNRNFPLALVAIFAEGLTFFAANEYFAFEVSLFTGEDLLVAGLHFGVVFLACTLVALIAGVYSVKAKAVRIPIVVGFTLMLVFNICLATSTPSTRTGAFWGFPVLLGSGLGIILPTIMVTAQLSTPPDLISTASALILAVRSFGATVGLAVNNAIFKSTLSTQLPKKIAAAALPLGLPKTSFAPLIGALSSQNQALLASIPGVTPKIIGAAANALLQAYSVSFRYCWVAAACFCFVAVVASLFFFDPKDQFNTHIDAPAEKHLIEVQAIFEGERAPVSSHGTEKEAEGQA